MNKLKKWCIGLRSMLWYFQLGIHHNSRPATTFDCLPQLYKGKNRCIEWYQMATSNDSDILLSYDLDTKKKFVTKNNIGGCTI